MNLGELEKKARLISLDNYRDDFWQGEKEDLWRDVLQLIASGQCPSPEIYAQIALNAEKRKDQAA